MSSQLPHKSHQRVTKNKVSAEIMQFNHYVIELQQSVCSVRIAIEE